MIELLFDYRVIFTLIILFLLYKLGSYDDILVKRFGRKGPTPLPFVGNMIGMSKYGMHQYDIMNREKYGNLYPFYFGVLTGIIVSDEELMKQILIKEFKCFTDRNDIGIGKDTKNFLTRLKGKDWERVRNIVSPTFTSGKLKKMSPLIEDCVRLLENKIMELKDQPVDIKEVFGALTMDVISRTMFGMEIDSQKNPNNKFIINAKKLFSFSLTKPLMLLIFLCPSLARMLEKYNLMTNAFGGNTIKFFRDTVSRAIEERKKLNSDEYNDFLSLMLKEKEEEDNEGETELSSSTDTTLVAEAVTSSSSNNKRLSLEEILAQSIIFLLAGYETTATAISFCCFYLARNPEMQEEVYEELVGALGSSSRISYDALARMPLLDQAINETLRISPPAVRFDRLCTQDVDLTTEDGRTIHVLKGDVFHVPVYAIHHDPALWPEPERYDLHRFDADLKKDRSPYSFMAFGMGPRNCVGMRFALLEVKWAIVNTMIQFQILPCTETPEKIIFKNVGLSQPITPIKLQFSPRN